MVSRFNGRRIQPPATTSTKPKNVATPEIKEWVIQLHETKPVLSNRQLTRLVFREFGIEFSYSSVANWVRAHKKESETQNA